MKQAMFYGTFYHLSALPPALRDRWVPVTTRLAEAPSFGKPINHYDKYSSGSAAYQLLAEEFLARLGI